MTEYAAIVKVPEYPPHLKHQTIFQTFDGLNPSESMLIINDHDPVPLRFQLESMHKGNYGWEYIEQGPSTFQVKVTKLS
ncbi:DUF2249 domain-containing protein [Sporosarcina sp. HYO08]|uniref:DUF2249 domain-containing protein n=1 Tax=Sporosarcina sp. HYO08 TaxID=1759557 RepID=UPI00079CC569|nr:DUF2249 domain-containing protein [Sporosarcina sp. HYO08]KXH78806.1 hypothetical protein AU377_12460 [Sporosarcina sp. HYO08]